MLKKLLGLLSDAAVYGVSSMLSRIVGLLVLPILTRYLTPGDYGVVSMLTLLSTFMGPIANLGMTNALFRRFNVDKDPAVRAQLFATTLFSVTISSLIVLVAMISFPGQIAQLLLGDASYASYVQISLITSAVTSIGVVPFVTMRAGRQVKLAALVNVAKLLISVAITLWLVMVKNAGVWGVLWGSLLGELSVVVVQLAFSFRSYLAPINKSLWKQMLAYGLPMVPHQLFAAAMEFFGLLMVRDILDIQEAGIYGVAIKLASPIMFVVGAIQASWVPYKFQIHSENTDSVEFFRSSFLYYVLAVSYLWVGVSLWGPDVVRIMTAPDFHAAASLVWAVALIPVARGIYFMCGTGIELGNSTRLYPLVSLSGLVVVVALSFALIPTWGAMGAAIATTCGWAAMSAVVYHLSQRQLRIDHDWTTILLAAIGASAVVVAGDGVQQLPWLPRLLSLVMLSLAYPVACLALLSRIANERARMQILVSRLRKLRAS